MVKLILEPSFPKNETRKFLKVKKAAECGCRAAFFPAEMEFPLCSFIDHAECISPKVRKNDDQNPALTAYYYR